MSEPIEEFEQWLVGAIDLALGCYAEGDEAPFLVGLDGLGQQHLVEIQVEGEVDGDSIWKLGRELVAEDWRRYAIVMSGFYSAGSAKKPAVIMECAECDMPEAVILAQPFRQKKRPPSCERAGDIVIIDRPPNLLKSAKRKKRS